MAITTLCEVCSKIDFHLLVGGPSRPRNGQPVPAIEGSTASEPSDGTSIDNAQTQASKWELGTIQEILNRKSACDLCAIICESLKDQTYNDNDLCSVQTVHLLTIYEEDLTKPGVKLDRVAIVLNPGVPAISTTNPISAVDSRPPPPRSRIIVELQRCQKSISRSCEDSKATVEPLPSEGDQPALNTAGESPIDDNSTLPKLNGRIIKPDRADIHLFKQWLHQCEHDHGSDCSEASMAASLMTLLVIDVQSRCVVRAGAASRSNCRYVALSYCWGLTPMLRHVRSNTRILQQRGSLDSADVPQTIRDAMTLVLDMGERYLWVDSLCIVQDDPINSTYFVSKMDVIFSRAILTIIVAAGVDARGSIPGIRTGTRSIHQPIIHLSGFDLIPAIDGSYYKGVAGSRWQTRGWTMQESILSRRRLIFTEKQVYWRCAKAIWLEETILENLGNVHLQKFLRVPGNISNHGFKTSGIEHRYYEMYEQIVTSYLRRQLTFESDTLNAFTGITHSLSTVGPRKQFLWGLPESKFGWALTWELDGAIPNNASHISPSTRWIRHFEGGIRFPSWSWSAWKRGSKHQHIRWLERGADKNYIEPEVFFYRENVKGDYLPICEDRHRISESFFWHADEEVEKTRRLWNEGATSVSTDEHSLYTDLETDFLDSGRLRFWSSVAQVNIQRSSHVDPKSQWYVFTPENGGGFHDEVRISMGNTEHLNWERTTQKFYQPRASPVDTSTSDGDHPGQLEDPQVDELVFRDVLVFKAHFVVIGRSIRDPNRLLNVLIVHWIDEVAYRVGCAAVSEKDWVGIKYKEWKIVTLG